MLASGASKSIMLRLQMTVILKTNTKDKQIVFKRGGGDGKPCTVQHSLCSSRFYTSTDTKKRQRSLGLNSNPHPKTLNIPKPKVTDVIGLRPWGPPKAQPRVALHTLALEEWPHGWAPGTKCSV